MHNLYSMLNESFGLNGTLKKEIVEDANAKLDDATENEVNDLISNLHDLQDTIKHTIYDEMISINAKISELNNKVKYSVEELDTDSVYYNISGVLKDLEYLIQESNWAREDLEVDQADEN